MVLVMFTSTLVMKLTELPRQDIGFTDGICIDKAINTEEKKRTCTCICWDSKRLNEASDVQHGFGSPSRTSFHLILMVDEAVS